MRRLIGQAKEARKLAYAPYSRYKVGAALEAGDGRIFTGCNVENASYGLTNCAERTAIFKAISEGARRFLRIAIVTSSDKPAEPCGACRQVLAEFAPDIEVIVANGKGVTKRYRLPELLPQAFRFRKRRSGKS